MTPSLSAEGRLRLSHTGQPAGAELTVEFMNHAARTYDVDLNRFLVVSAAKHYSSTKICGVIKIQIRKIVLIPTVQFTLSSVHLLSQSQALMLCVKGRSTANGGQAQENKV